MVEDSVTQRIEVEVTSPSSPSCDSPGDPPSIYLTLLHTNLLHTSPESTWAFRMGRLYADTKERHADARADRLQLILSLLTVVLQLTSPSAAEITSSYKCNRVCFSTYPLSNMGNRTAPFIKLLMLRGAPLLCRNMSFIVWLSVTPSQEVELI